MFWFWLVVIIIMAFFSLLFACSFMGAISNMGNLSQELYSLQELGDLQLRMKKEARLAICFISLSILLMACVITLSAIFLH